MEPSFPREKRFQIRSRPSYFEHINAEKYDFSTLNQKPRSKKYCSLPIFYSLLLGHQLYTRVYSLHNRIAYTYPIDNQKVFSLTLNAFRSKNILGIRITARDTLEIRQPGYAETFINKNRESTSHHRRAKENISVGKLMENVSRRFHR